MRANAGALRTECPVVALVTGCEPTPVKTSAAILLLLLLALCQPALATKHRGVWFWRDAGSPYGADNIVGVAGLENATVAFFGSHSIRRVYGSYGDRPITAPAVIATWNSKLHGAGLQSQSLLSENTWIQTAIRPALLTLITTRVLNFNAGRPATEKFDGLHLDIEPQALPEWSGLTPAQKRAYLLLLRDTYADVRAHLVSAGQPTFPVYADLPVWFDNLPVDGGSIGWLNAADRDLWFASIAVSLTGITLMPFDRQTFTSINSGVMWERANVTGAVVRTGLEADIGVGLTWASLPNFNAMMETVEAAYGPTGAVDIQSYRQWREAIAAQPIIPVSALHLAHTALGADLVFPAEPLWTHVILYSPNLCNWQEIARYRGASSAQISHPVDMRATRGYWQVFRFQELE